MFFGDTILFPRRNGVEIYDIRRSWSPITTVPLQGIGTVTALRAGPTPATVVVGTSEGVIVTISLP
jgi:hypothetical protein